jgi:hypothetical protein
VKFTKVAFFIVIPLFGPMPFLTVQDNAIRIYASNSQGLTSKQNVLIFPDVLLYRKLTRKIFCHFDI